MSKNFELMQQTGNDQEFRPVRKAKPSTREFW